MSIGNAHSHADSNTIGDTDANRNTCCDPNSDATVTDTNTNGNSNGRTNSNGYCNGDGDVYTYADTYSDRTTRTHHH